MGSPSQQLSSVGSPLWRLVFFGANDTCEWSVALGSNAQESKPVLAATRGRTISLVAAER